MTAVIEELSKKIHVLGDSFTLDKIPQKEREEDWFCAIAPIVNNFLKLKNPANTLFIRCLFDKSHTNWNVLKNTITWAQANLENWQQVLGISARIESSNDPDTVIYSALAEITAAKYLVLRGFV